MRYKFKGVILYDVIEPYSEEVNWYTQMCNDCLKKYNIKEGDGLSLDSFGHGICGVEGCYNEADMYVDFLDKNLLVLIGDTPRNVKVKDSKDIIIRDMAKYIGVIDSVDSICRNTIYKGGCLLEKDKYGGKCCGIDMRIECIINHFKNNVQDD